MIPTLINRGEETYRGIQIMINALLKTGPDFDQTPVTIMIPWRHMEVGGNALDSGLALAASLVYASREAFCNMIGSMLIT